jgi:hypothetical protein
MSDCEAIRASGQALMALWRGRSILDVNAEGISTVGSDEPPSKRSYQEVAVDIAIWLGGIAALNTYRFGRLDDHSRLQTWGFDRTELGDFAQVRELEAGIDPDGGSDHLVSGWFESLAFLSRPGLWEAIESIAEELQRRPLTPAEVETLAAGAFWSANVPAADTTSDS